MTYCTTNGQAFGSHTVLWNDDQIIRKTLKDTSLTPHYSDISTLISEYKTLVTSHTSLEVPETIHSYIDNGHIIFEEEFIQGQSILQAVVQNLITKPAHAKDLMKKLVYAILATDIPLDCTPSNFIVTTEGKVYYIDFFPPMQVITAAESVRKMFFPERSVQSLRYCFMTPIGRILKFLSLVNLDMPELHTEVVTLCSSELKSYNEHLMASLVEEESINGYDIYSKMKRADNELLVSKDIYQLLHTYA